MVGRVARYEMDPSRCNEAIDAFLEAAREISQLPGFEGGYVMVDSENGAVMTWTLWQDHATLEASATHAAAMRRRAIAAVEGDVASVQTFNVVRRFGD